MDQIQRRLDKPIGISGVGETRPRLRMRIRINCKNSAQIQKIGYNLRPGMSTDF